MFVAACTQETEHAMSDMFFSITSSATEAWTEPPKDMEHAQLLWRDYWYAIGALEAVQAMLKSATNPTEEG